MSKKSLTDYGIIGRWKFIERILGFKTMLNLYLPFLGAGIRVEGVDRNFHWVEVSLRQNLFNTNYVGVHFGGSIYAMCDPFYMFILMRHLGRDCIVWDKSARVEFLKPGRGKVRARFEIPPAEIERIRETVVQQRKMDVHFTCVVVDESGSPIAKVEKTLYVRRKKN